MAARKITVNAVAPGTTESDLIKGFTPEEISRLEQSVPAGRLGKPEDIAETVAFLASDAASFIIERTFTVKAGCMPCTQKIKAADARGYSLLLFYDMFQGLLPL